MSAHHLLRTFVVDCLLRLFDFRYCCGTAPADRVAEHACRGGAAAQHERVCKENQVEV